MTHYKQIIVKQHTFKSEVKCILCICQRMKRTALASFPKPINIHKIVFCKLLNIKLKLSCYTPHFQPLFPGPDKLFRLLGSNV